MTRRAARGWLARAALCIALGLATTVAVAWALAAWPPQARQWRSVLVPERRAPAPRVSTAEFGRPGMLRRYWRIEERTRVNRWRDVRFDGFGSARSPFRDIPPAAYTPVAGPKWAPALAADDPRNYGWEYASGWPMLALWCEFNSSHGPSFPSEAHGGVVVRGSDNGLEVRVLPLRPLWPGLLGNTGVYTLAWGVVLVVPGWVRRTRRRAAGRCAGCGYDRAGLAEGTACPECGVD